MPKQLPDVHTCFHCKSFILTIVVNKDTETQTLERWKEFASPESVAALDADRQLETYLRSQFKTLNMFMTITPWEVRQKAEAGCRLFAYLLRKTEGIVRRLANTGSVVESNDPFKPFYYEQIFARGSRSDDDVDVRLFICAEPQPSRTLSSRWRFRWFVEPYRPFHCLYFQADDDVEGAHVSDDGVRIDLFETIVPPNSAYKFPRYFEFEPGSDQSLARARTFIESKRFVSGDTLTNSFAPTRLINFDILVHESHSQVKLVDAGDVSTGIQYATLSYCWGGDQKLKLTKKTFDQFTQGISFESLPMTLKDAVKVASKFNITYLWIDALCMIQDDAEDMGRELATMAKIYECAWLTISASRAKSVEEGFLQKRLPFKDNPQSSFCLWLTTADGNGTESVLCFLAADLVGYESPNMKISEAAFDGTARDPLVFRAWCYQERALSKRLIEFGALSTRMQISLPGLPTVIYNDGWKPLDELHSIPVNRGSVQHLLTIGDNRGSQSIDTGGLSRGHYMVDPAAPPGSKGVYEYWCSTLKFYSGLSLTFQKDRLPAFSAIASLFAPVFGGEDKYVAGIWRDTLPLGLLWVVYSENVDKDGMPAQPPPAPSWSWAIVSSGISYTFGREYSGFGWDFAKNFLTSGLEADQGIEVLDCKIQLTSKRVALGSVDRGELHLRGRILPVRMSLEKSLSLDMFGDETRIERARSHWRLAQDFANERGLHRRDYEHPDAAFRDQRLAAFVVIDRNEDAFEAMAAESQGLFALPVASGPSEKMEKGLNEQLYGTVIEMAVQFHNPERYRTWVLPPGVLCTSIWLTPTSPRPLETAIHLRDSAAPTAKSSFMVARGRDEKNG
ncbi:heterokaryon incompatibility protein-domain-containing protein [Xylariales sp. AK1849]|nr:heterokaryon incompatibility protein-domain-containing protein [Xylariales sp. AK1849]